MSAAGYTVRTWGGGYAVFRGDERVSGINHYGAAHDMAEKLTKAQPLRERACLRCKDTFLSEGAHHRMCAKCRITASDIFEGAV